MTALIVLLAVYLAAETAYRIILWRQSRHLAKMARRRK